MDIVRTVVSSLGCIKALVDLLDKSRELDRKLAIGLDSIKNDLDMLKGYLEEDEALQLQPRMQLKMQELAYDIDDFVRGLCTPGPGTSFFLSAMGMNITPAHITKIENFKICAKDLESKLEKGSESRKSGSSGTPAVCWASPSAGSTTVCHASKKEDLVGIAKPKQEIVDLLSPSRGPLRVISIVGCSGLGKTALAKAIYEDEDVLDKFDHKAWVVASDHSPADNLDKILQQLHMPPAPESTSEDLQHLSKNKRYLFVLDDVQQRGIVWKDIEEAFRENNMGSRIILTTRAPSVGAACSPGSYTYRMKCLGEKESEELLWRKVTNCTEASAKLAEGSKEIFLKCGGLPLALISAGENLSVTGRGLKRKHCEDLGGSLGEYLVGDGKDSFPEMKRALVQCYDKLTNHDHRNCLLYVSIFPRGHQINSKSLVRKLIAEDLIEKKGHACLDELIDHGMIEEVDIRDDSKVAGERCKAHNIMLEFTIKKAVARNFVTLIHKDKLHRSSHGGRVRRLTLQSGHNVALGSLKEEADGLSSLRSLTIFDSTGTLDLKSCRMMRVLDLEGCRWLNREIDDICKLVFVKYLSLRNTGITKLPEAIKKLKCLQALDIRDTSVQTLPIEVILMPQLAFLFGKFELPDLSGRSTQGWLQNFLQKRSKLQTIAGIVINGTKDFEIIILHARQLKKVKIWFKLPSHKSLGLLECHKRPTGSKLEETNTKLAGILVSSLQKRFDKFESVSIYFNWSRHQTKIKDFLGSMQATCIMSSIKLWGKLESLPEPDVLNQLVNIRKLHLFYTGLSIENLAVLQNLQYLEYLKIGEDEVGRWDGEFVIQDDGFPSLYLLCLEAQRLPKVIFQQGSMASLNSLQLLCQELPVEVEGISHLANQIFQNHLANLNEVILHHSAPDKTVDALKDAAILHVNRPFVKKQPAPN